MRKVGPSLKQDWKLRGIFAPVSEWMNRVSRRLDRVEVVGGFGRFTDDGLKLIIYSAFSGVAYVNGTKYSGLNSDSTKAWVKIPLDGTAPSEDAGPPPDPFPVNIEYYEKAATIGDIHVVGTR